MVVFIGIPKRGNKVHHSQDGYKRLDCFHSLSVGIFNLGGTILCFRRIRFLFRLILIDDGSVFLDIMSELKMFLGEGGWRFQRLAISDCPAVPAFGNGNIKIDICFEDEAILKTCLKRKIFFVCKISLF